MFRNLYRNIRLLPKRRKEPYVSFFKILNFYPYNITLYEQACLHKSSSIKLKNGKWINNERLEFLGDAILDAVVAEIIFKEFEYCKEGFLTNMRAKIVQRETLNQLAIKVGIDRLVKTAAKKTLPNTHMFGNALEALIGAIFLDQGYARTKKFIAEELIKKHLDIDSVAETEDNYKSKLIEWGQKQKVEIHFDLVESSISPDNIPTFKTEVRVLEEVLGYGTGLSKKESQQIAAKEALDKLKDNVFFDDLQKRYQDRENNLETRQTEA